MNVLTCSSSSAIRAATSAREWTIPEKLLDPHLQPETDSTAWSDAFIEEVVSPRLEERDNY